MSAPSTRTIERCLACGDHHPVWRLAMRYEWQGASFPLVQCSDCSIRYLRVQPVGETLAAMYSAEYFQADFRCGRSDTRSDDEAAFRAENDGLLDRFERYRGRGRLLEVGSAYGLLLARAAARGWTPTGVELSPEAVAHARARGLDVRQGTLEDAGLPAGSFDLVYMGDVLEHVPDCRDTLARAVELLAPGGHLFLRGPITTNSLARRVGLALYRAAGRTIVLREPPYHLWEFTPGSLRWLARAVGLDVVELQQAKIPPGRAHGSKSTAQRAAMGLLDALNVPLTGAFNRLGDRVVMIARKP